MKENKCCNSNELCYENGKGITVAISSARKCMYLLTILMICCVVMLMSTVVASAADSVASGTCGANGDNLTWTLDSEGVLTISGSGEMQDYGGETSHPWSESAVKAVKINGSVTNIGAYAFVSCSNTTSIEIPNSVVSIGDGAFWGCSSLTSMKIPNSVTSIGESALEECSNLTIIEMPNSVTSIGKSAFHNCKSLTNVKIPSSVTCIEVNTFAECSSLKSVKIPDSVTNIGKYAFFCCRGLTSIEIPSSVISIGHQAFFGCDSLTSLKIPNGVTSIGETAFGYCHGLTSIEIPKSVTSIGIMAFSCGENLVNISVDKENKIYDSRNNCNGIIETKSNTLIEACRTTSIPIGVTRIGDSAFAYLDGLTNIKIPNSVTNIENYAFCCSSLTGVEIPNSVTSIGDRAFESCSNLTSVEIPDSVMSIGETAFAYCSNLKKAKLSNSITSTGEWTFAYCSSLTSITIPNSVTSIGSTTFIDCISLTSIEIPSSVTSIEERAFEGCSKLTSVKIPGSVKSIGNSAFSGCSSLTSIEIPNGVASIGISTFIQCNNLTSIEIPNSVKSIGGSAFYECSSLTDVYYSGTARQWSKISIGASNDNLTNANKHFSSQFPKIANEQYGIMVVNSNGDPISGATVQWNSETKTTPANGTVFFDKFTIGQPRIIVTCTGYGTYDNKSINYEKNEQGYDIVRLYTDSESDYKLKSAVYTAGISKCDVLNGTKRLSTSNSSSSFTLSCRAEGADIANYTLLQNSKIIKTSVSGDFSLKVGNLSVGGGVEVVVTAASGKSASTHINLELVKDQAQKNLSCKLGGEKVEFTVPDDTPFIGGNKFTLDIPRLEGDMIDFYCDDDTIHIGINCKLNKDDKNSFEESVKDLKSLFTRLKQVQKYDIGNSLQAKINYLMKDKNLKADIGPIKGECRFIGYGEGKFDENGLANVKVYLCFIVSAKATIQGPTTWVIVAPVTYSVEISGEAKFIGEGNWDLDSDTIGGDLTTTITPKLKAFGGVGLNNKLRAGAYGSAELPIEIQLLGTSTSTGVNSVDLTGELGLEVCVGALKYEKAFAYKTWHLYTRTNNLNSNALLNSEAVFNLAEMFDADEYQLADISYLSEESDWLGTQKSTARMLRSLASVDVIDNNELQALQTGTYRNMQPVLGNANGTPVMVWVKANTERGDYDYPQLVYSVYNNGSWCEPKPVDNNSTCDAAPVFFTDDSGTLWLAYQDSSTTTTDGITLADYASKQAIVAGYFDKGSNSFVNLTTLSSDGVFSCSPSIGEMNGNVIVAWQANSDYTDYFCQNNTNSLCYAIYGDGSWGTVNTASENMNAFTEIAVGDAGICVIVDGDNDLSTSDDRQLKLYDEDMNVSNIDDGTVSAAEFAALPGETNETLLWSNGESLCQYVDGETKSVVTNESLSNGYMVLSDRLIYNAADDEGSELFAQVYENGSWCDPVAITQQDKYLQSYSAAEIAGETWLTAVQTTVSISEDEVTDVCDLVWAKLTDVKDVKISAVTIDHRNEAPNTALPVEVDLTNCGDTEIHQVNLCVTSDDTQITEQTVAIDLAPGETGTAELSFDLGESVSERNYVVTATVDNDRNLDDNSSEFVAGLCDMEVSAELLHIGDNSSILAKVTNQGAASSAGKLDISGADGTIANAEIERLDSGESTYVLVQLSENLLGRTSDVLTLQLEPAESDFDEINNMTQLYVGLENSDYTTESDALITVGSVTAKPGKSFTVPVRISGNTGIRKASLTFDYNESLTLTNITSGEAFSSLTMTKPENYSSNQFVIAWDGSAADTSNGVIAYLTFTAPEAEGSYDISVSFDTGDIVDGKLKSIEIDSVQGKAVVISSHYGAIYLFYGLDDTIGGKSVCYDTLMSVWKENSVAISEDDFTSLGATYATHSQNFDVSQIVAGQYKLAILKSGYTPWISSDINVGSEGLNIADIDIYRWGDADGDGAITASDAQQLQRKVAGIKSSLDVYASDATMYKYLLTCCDANNDGALTAADAQEIQRCVAGLPSTIDNFPS